ncbi:unnamed protein product, partial [Porites evermanni]
MRFAALQVLILFFTATEETISGCLSPLGMKSRFIKDDQISASSSMSDLQLPSAGRLHNTASLGGSLGAWCSDDTDDDQWFQIDLLTTMNVSAVASQGFGSQGFGYGDHWVTQYSLNYSCDGVRWFRYTLQGGHEVSNRAYVLVVWGGFRRVLFRFFFTLDPLNSKPHYKKGPGRPGGGGGGEEYLEVNALLMLSRKDWPKLVNQALSSKREVPSSVFCSEPLGMQSGAINNSQIKASSYKSSWTRPSEGRLHNQLSLQKRSFGGWCAKDSDNHPFLQVNLKTSTVITALATQGLPLRDNSALRYKLNYSCDGKVWFEYQDGKVI